MLAQNFKSAQELGLKEVEHDALIKVLGLLERGDLNGDTFNMKVLWDADENECLTQGCLCGWASATTGGVAFPYAIKGSPKEKAEMVWAFPEELRKLFWMDGNAVLRNKKPSVERAAEVLRTYLVTGKSTWTFKEMCY